MKKKFNQYYFKILNPILIATKITKKDVSKAKVLLEKIFIFIKLPIWPPKNTTRKNGQKSNISLETCFFVKWPIMPKIEFSKINNEAVLVICFGYPAFSKNKIGLKNIPPPIPITPETKPIAEPIEKEKYLLIELNLVIFFS